MGASVLVCESDLYSDGHPSRRSSNSTIHALQRGVTPLHWAARHGASWAVRLLLQHPRVLINIKTEVGLG